MSEPSKEFRDKQREVALHDEAAFNAAFESAASDEAACTLCGGVKPHAEFPYLSTAILKCKDCLKTEHANATHDGKEKVFNRGAMLIAKRMENLIEGKKPLNNAPHITEYLDELVRQMGGTPNVVSRWLQQLAIAEGDPKKQGSKTVLDQYQFIGKLILYSTEHRATAPDVTLLSREQLAVEKQRVQIQMIVDSLLEAADPTQRKAIEQTVAKLALVGDEELEAA